MYKYERLASTRHQSIEATMADSRGTEALPNILLSTTYALNKSNSKRVCVGLEMLNDHYRPVVKLVSAGSVYRTVTLDTEQWEALKNQFETIGSYFNKCYDFYRQFGNNHTSYIPGYEIKYATTYGNKSIIIDEKSEEQNSQHFVEEQEEERVQDNDVQTSSRKKTKVTHLAGIAMQHTTFEGLSTHALLVDLHLTILKMYLGPVTHSIDAILQYLRSNLAKDASDSAEKERVKNIVSDIRVFKQYFATNFAAIEGYVEKEEGHIYDSTMKLVLYEILAFGLHDLRQIFENHLHLHNYFNV